MEQKIKNKISKILSTTAVINGWKIFQDSKSNEFTIYKMDDRLCTIKFQIADGELIFNIIGTAANEVSPALSPFIMESLTQLNLIKNSILDSFYFDGVSLSLIRKFSMPALEISWTTTFLTHMFSVINIVNETKHFLELKVNLLMQVKLN